MKVGTLGDLARNRRTIWLSRRGYKRYARMDAGQVAQAHGAGMALQVFIEQAPTGSTAPLGMALREK